jgi:hypothetical protein
MVWTTATERQIRQEQGAPRPSGFGHKDWEQAHFTSDRSVERLSILLGVKFDYGVVFFIGSPPPAGCELASEAGLGAY